MLCGSEFLCGSTLRHTNLEIAKKTEKNSSAQDPPREEWFPRSAPTVDDACVVFFSVRHMFKRHEWIDRGVVNNFTRELSLWKWRLRAERRPSCGEAVFASPFTRKTKGCFSFSVNHRPYHTGYHKLTLRDSELEMCQVSVPHKLPHFTTTFPDYWNPLLRKERSLNEE